MLNIPHRLRLRQKTMLCCARQMQSSAYSPRARRPLDLRPQQRCVAGAEGPPIKRHESAYVEREEDVVLPSDECSRPRGASPLKTRESCIPVHLTQGPGRTGRTPGATMTPHTALHNHLHIAPRGKPTPRGTCIARHPHPHCSPHPVHVTTHSRHTRHQFMPGAHTPCTATTVHAWDTHTMYMFMFSCACARNQHPIRTHSPRSHLNCGRGCANHLPGSHQHGHDAPRRASQPPGAPRCTPHASLRAAR
jgi:hypothetical protein